MTQQDDLFGAEPPRKPSLPEAKRQRDRGMALALANAEKRAALRWRAIAYDFLTSFARQHATFISEDVSDSSKELNFPQPPTDRAWGAIYVRAAKDGLIVQDGTGRSRRRHASLCPRWRSLVYRT